MSTIEKTTDLISKMSIEEKKIFNLFCNRLIEKGFTIDDDKMKDLAEQAKEMNKELEAYYENNEDLDEYDR